MNTGNYRILLVDDHEIVRQGLRVLIEASSEFQICGEAKTGAEAVEASWQLAPDSVIMDVGLPDVSGLAATKQIGQEMPAVKVVIFSMHFSEELVRQAVNAGAWGYVSKSQGGEALIRALEALRLNRKHFPLRRLPPEQVHGSDPPSAGAIPKRGLLTSREREIVTLLALGQSNKEAAHSLGISVKTAETHRARVMKKLALRSFAELVHHAIRHHLIFVVGNEARATAYGMESFTAPQGIVS